MKKKTIAIIAAITIVLSGAAGIGGTCLANLLCAPAEPVSSYRSVGIGQEVISAGTEGEMISVASSSSSSASSSKASASSSSSSSKKALTIPKIASKTANSVVEIYTEMVTRGIFLRQYVAEGAGSGVIIKSNGYILTCNHVIEGARKITVRLKNGKEYPASVVGRDSNNDVAVIKINTKDLAAVTYGDSSKLVVGELAVAVGNPLGQLGGSVTEGIISALGRKIDIDGKTLTLLQTSAAINPGNSGGALFNQYGEMIGLVSVKTSGIDVEGLGFAIPSNTVKTIAANLMK